MVIQTDSHQMIDSLCRQYKRAWEDTPDTFPAHRPRDVRRRKARQARMDGYTDEIIRLVKGFVGGGSTDYVRWGSKLKYLIYQSGIEVLELDGDNMRLLLEGGFCETTSDFIEKAREFDADFKTDCILQSLRNVWIMNCIQKLLGRGVSMTPSVFAYSMLYPYTDNYLDANSIPEDKKNGTNHVFKKRLAGEALIAGSPLEDKLFRLVGIIENEYERSLYPMVYESLLGIQAAQEKSMSQTVDHMSVRRDVSGISIEKGGCSVLADGYLTRGVLSAAEASFTFGFGVLLQLLDDLQDVTSDRNNRHLTVFSGQVPAIFQERNTNRLINFTMRFFDEDTCFVTSSAMQIKNLMKESILFLLMGAVACNSGMYDGSYLKRLETYSPLYFKFLKNLYRRVGREYGRLQIRLAVKPLEIPMAKAFASGNLE